MSHTTDDRSGHCTNLKREWKPAFSRWQTVIDQSEESDSNATSNRIIQSVLVSTTALPLTADELQNRWQNHF